MSELNPYVEVNASTIPLALLDDAAQAFLREFTLVVLADTPLHEAQAIDEFCRAQSPPIGVVYADVKGLFSMVFVDFGAGFEVVDSTGEELKETYISDVTKESEGKVTTVANLIVTATLDTLLSAPPPSRQADTAPSTLTTPSQNLLKSAGLSSNKFANLSRA